MFSLDDLKELEELTQSIGQEFLMPYFQNVSASYKSDGSIVTDADLVLQRELSHELAKRWENFPILGEEMEVEDQEALVNSSDNGLWIIDPLDGTNNFATGIPFFCISISLVKKDEVIAGVVYDPIRREIFSALKGKGAWLNKEPLLMAANNAAFSLQEAIAIVDLKRLPNNIREYLVRKTPFRSHRSFGAVALDWCWMASGRAQLYLHGGQKLWDYAAGSLIFFEAGGIGGLFLNYTRENNNNIDLSPRIAIAASSKNLFEKWLRVLEEASN